jgi:hypothetical protein
VRRRGIDQLRRWPWHRAVNILEFRGHKVARETIYVTEPWDAPEWRAPWRAARSAGFQPMALASGRRLSYLSRFRGSFSPEKSLRQANASS